jgi:hypothetical protein
MVADHFALPPYFLVNGQHAQQLAQLLVKAYPIGG